MDGIGIIVNRFGAEISIISLFKKTLFNFSIQDYVKNWKPEVAQV